MEENKKRKVRNLSHEEFLEKLWKVKNKDDFEILSTYEETRKKMKFKHKCGCIFEATPNNMLKKEYGGCPDCGAINRKWTRTKTLQTVINEVEEKYPDQYIIDPNQHIENNKSKFKVQCKTCGHVYEVSSSNILRGRGCPLCNRIQSNTSKNARKVIQHLEEKGLVNSTSLNVISDGLHFKQEVYLEGCNNDGGRKLWFDFVIYDGEKVIHAIEYDGELHDRPFYKGAKARPTTLNAFTNDESKNRYCKENNIPLLRLRYDNFTEYKSIIDSALGFNE